MTKITIGYETLVKNSITEPNIEIDYVSMKIRDQLFAKLKLLQENLGKLTHQRTKRGLINALGSIVKFITGNPDDNDLQAINENIKELHENQNSGITKINQLTSFANHVTKRFNEQIETINQNLAKTQLYFNRQLNIESYRIILQDEIFQAEKLLHTLFLLERSISLALNDIPNLEIISMREFREMQDYLKTIYGPQQLLPIDQDHLFKLLEGTKFSIFGINQTITFMLKVPIVKPFLSKISKIYPIPNNHSVLIIPPKKNLISTPTGEFWTDEECKTLSSTILCLTPPTPEKCSLSVLNSCTTAKATNDFEIIHPLNNNEILTIFKNQKEIVEDCHGLVSHHFVQGANLISSPCFVRIGKTTFYNSTPTYEICTPDIANFPVDFNQTVDFKYKHLVSPTDLQQDVDSLQANILEPHSILQHSISFTTLLLITVLIILLVCYRKRLNELLCQPRTVIHVRASDHPLDEGVQDLRREEL